MSEIVVSNMPDWQEMGFDSKEEGLDYVNDIAARTKPAETGGETAHFERTLDARGYSKVTQHKISGSGPVEFIHDPTHPIDGMWKHSNSTVAPLSAVSTVGAAVDHPAFVKGGGSFLRWAPAPMPSAKRKKSIKPKKKRSRA